MILIYNAWWCVNKRSRTFNTQPRKTKAAANALLFIIYFLLACVALCLSDCLVLRYDLYPDMIEKCRIFVINLDSSEDRLDYIKKLMKEKELAFERIRAVDGNDLDFYDFDTGEPLKLEEVSNDKLLTARKMYVGYKGDKRDMIFDYDFRKSYPKGYKYKMSIGELGCCYSHRLAWKRVVDEDLPYAVVFEDDIVLYDDFSERLLEVLKAIPSEADFISINQRARWARPPKTSETEFVRPCTSGVIRVMCTGMYAYIITNQGARKLLEITRNTAAPIDIEVPMAHISKKINQYVVVKRMLNHNYSLDSVLTRMGRKGWDEDQKDRSTLPRRREKNSDKSKTDTTVGLGKSAKGGIKPRKSLRGKLKETKLKIKHSRMSAEFVRKAKIAKSLKSKVRAATNTTSEK